MKGWTWLALTTGLLAAPTFGHAASRYAAGPSFALSLTDANPAVGSVQVQPVMTLRLNQSQGPGDGALYTLTFTEFGDGSDFWNQVRDDIRHHQEVAVTVTFAGMPGSQAQSITLDQAVAIQRKEAVRHQDDFDSLPDLGLEEVTLVFQSMTFAQDPLPPTVGGLRN